jgi:GT2 family glycosyltransferase
MPKVVAIVLNWNNAAETDACLSSLGQPPGSDLIVFVVDNGSTDDSVGQIKASHPGVKILETGSNLGYAEGNNVGIRHALSLGVDYVLLVNNDVRLAADTVAALVSAAETSPEAAFLGPRIFERDQPHRVQSNGIDLDWLWRSRHRTESSGAADGIEEVRCLSGAVLLLRASALERVGLLDSSFFMYREDIDWCFRASRLGYRILCVPGARAWHRNHRSGESDLPRITYYMTRNSLLLVTKHRGGALRLGALLGRDLLTALSWSLRPRWRHKRGERKALVLGMIDFFRGRVGYTYA